MELQMDRRAWATFDKSGAYRYTLGRSWDATKGRCAFVMLNPSTATASELDPTVRRCVGFAKRWDFGSLEVGNIFALRSTDPEELYKVEDPVGPENDKQLIGIQSRAAIVVAAWGNHGAHQKRGAAVRDLLQPGGRVYCLGATNEGQPKHPLYVSQETRLLLFQGQGGRR